MSTKYFYGQWCQAVTLENRVVQAVIGATHYGNMILLLCRLYWLPVCFWGQFKRLVITLKPFLAQSLLPPRSPVASAHLVWSSRAVCSESHQLKNTLLQKASFLGCNFCPAPGSAPRHLVAPALMSIRKLLKI